MARKKILLLTLQPPRMPGMGGEVRSYYLIRTATELGDVTLVSLGGSDGIGRVQEEIASSCVRVIQPSDRQNAPPGEPVTKSRLAAWWRLLLVFIFPWRNRWSEFLSFFLQYCPAISARTPGSYSKRVLRFILQFEFDLLSHWVSIPPITCFLFDAAFRRISPQVDQVCQEEQFDLLWVEHSLAWPFAEYLLSKRTLSDLPVVCSGHNVETRVCQRIADQYEGSHERWYWERQHALMSRMECRAYQRANLVIQCSENDALLTREMAPEAKVAVVGNGVNVDYFQTHQQSFDSQPTILFTAGFGYGPNREAVEYFVRQIFPLILEQCPDAHFLMAGSQAKEVFRSLEINGPSVECVSDPIDIRPCFERAVVYVVPLLAGGGTRLKILEAMAMGRPVVSTSLGAEGVPYVNGTHILLADDPRSFAEQVARLLQDESLRRRLAENAMQFVRANYDWRMLCDAAKSHLAALL